MLLMADQYSTAYSGEASKAQLDMMTKAKNQDFTAVLTYYVAERVGAGIGNDNAGNASEYYILRPITVNKDNLVEETRRFTAHVAAGRAFLTNTLPTTTTTTPAP